MKKKKNKSKKKIQLFNRDTQFIVTMGIFMVIALILTRFFQDTIYIFFILTSCIFLYMLSYSSKFKFFFRSLSIFLFLHLIVFPLIYVLILKKDTASFEFDSTIFNNEKEYSISNVRNKYDSKKLNKDIETINLVINEKSDKLKLNLKYLNEGNIIFTSKYMISKNCNDDFRRNRPSSLVALNISNLNGTLVSSISTNSEGCSFGNSDRTILNFLVTWKEILSKKNNRFQENYEQITENNGIWSYRQILPYSLNVFFTGNMTPKSKTANIVFFFHQIIVFAFLLSIVVNQFPLTKNSDDLNE